MKRIIFILFLFLWSATGSVFAQGSWTAFVTGIGGNPPQAASFLNEKFGFVETAGNWYRTADGGKTWALVQGLGVKSLLHLNFFYDTPDHIIVNGAYETTDGGSTWQKLGNPSISESIYEQDGTIYDADGRMSFDHALNWQQIIGYSGGEAIVGNMDKGIAMWGGQGFGIPLGSSLFTTDGGYTWHIGQTGIESDFGYAFPFTFTYLRSGGDGNDQIQRTTDGGATWQTVFKPLQSSSWYLTDGIKGDGCVVYVQTDTTHLSPSGLIRSTDQGITWVGVGGPTCTDDAPVCGVCSRGGVCFAMDYFSNGNNTIWKYTDPSLITPILNDMTIDRVFPDTIFMNACDTADMKVRLHFTACDFIRFHDLRIDSVSPQNYESFFSLDTIIRTGFPDSGTIALMPTAPGIYRLKVHISVAASDWTISDTTLPFVLVVAGHPPSLIISPDDTVNFGAKPICFSGGQDSILLTNPSCESLTVTQVRFESDTAGQSAYSVTMGVPFDIVRGSSAGRINIIYHPRSAGIKTGKIIIVTTIGNDTIPVFANALPDTAKLTIVKNTPIDFGSGPLCLAGGKDTVFLFDSSCIPLKVTGIVFEADSSPSSEFVISTQSPYDLQFGKPAGRFIVIFQPLTSGIKTGRIIIKTSIGNDTIPVSATILPDGRSLGFTSDSIASPICDSAEAIVTIHNLSCRQMSLDSLLLQAPFSIAPKQLPVYMNSGDSAMLRVRFAPSLRGPQKITGVAWLRIYLPGGAAVFDTTLDLLGIGLRGASAYSLSNTTVAFDTISLCDSTQGRLVVFSTGCDSLPLQNIVITGDPDLQVSGIGGHGPEIASGDSVVITVSLNPASIGNKSGAVTITFSDSSQATVPVTATIVRVKRILSGTPGGIIDFGKQLTCQNGDTVITLKNPSCDSIVVTTGGLQGSGFATNTKFPITLLPGASAQIEIFTVLDTSLGSQSNSSQLTITSDADNVLAPITFTREYTYPHAVHLWLEGDKTPLTASGTWTVNLKGRPDELTDVQTIDLSIDYNTDLLGYLSNASSVQSSDGKIFHLAGSPAISAGSDSTIANIAFEVYLTRDSVTSLVFNSIILNSADANFMACVASAQTTGIDFHYLNACADRSLRTFMQDGNAIEITSIRPNPAQDELGIDLQSAVKQDALVEIFDALGVKVFSGSKNLVSGSNSIHLDTKGLSEGMYILRVGRVSESFLKVK